MTRKVKKKINTKHFNKINSSNVTHINTINDDKLNKPISNKKIRNGKFASRVMLFVFSFMMSIVGLLTIWLYPEEMSSLSFLSHKWSFYIFGMISILLVITTLQQILLSEHGALHESEMFNNFYISYFSAGLITFILFILYELLNSYFPLNIRELPNSLAFLTFLCVANLVHFLLIFNVYKFFSIVNIDIENDSKKHLIMQHIIGFSLCVSVLILIIASNYIKYPIRPYYYMELGIIVWVFGFILLSIILICTFKLKN